MGTVCSGINRQGNNSELQYVLKYIRGESFDGTTVGMASQSSMCSKDRSGGVNVVRETVHLISVFMQ